MNHLVEKKQPLLNASGSLNEPGYAFTPVFDYHRKMIKASVWRIKEWDYYACMNSDFAFSFTVADLGYLGMVTATHLDFSTGKETKKTLMTPFPFGKFKMPNDIYVGDVQVSSKNYRFSFEVKKGERSIDVWIKDFLKGEDLQANLKLVDEKEPHMVIATPWKENPKAFYYNQKINCMPTSGTVKVGERSYTYDPSKHFSVLDWGRGVWTYKNTWFWGSMSSLVDGKRFGFNIGHGFGDTSKATENMVFYDGKAYKLDEVIFHMDDTDVMKPWTFTSNDGRFEMVMTPMLDRRDNTNMIIIKNFGHQVFGRFNGFVKLDDDLKLEIKDLIGFAEKITNHY